MSMTQNGSGEGTNAPDPTGTQHGDPLLSTVHGEPEEGSRQGPDVDETPLGQESLGRADEPNA
jgi:hypothetical protein